MNKKTKRKKKKRERIYNHETCIKGILQKEENYSRKIVENSRENNEYMVNTHK